MVTCGWILTTDKERSRVQFANTKGVAEGAVVGEVIGTVRIMETECNVVGREKIGCPLCIPGPWDIPS